MMGRTRSRSRLGRRRARQQFRLVLGWILACAVE